MRAPRIAYGGRAPLIASTSGYMSKKRVRTLAAKRGWQTRRKRYGKNGMRG